MRQRTERKVAYPMREAGIRVENVSVCSFPCIMLKNVTFHLTKASHVTSGKKRK